MRIALVVPDDSTACLYYGKLIQKLIVNGAKPTVISAPGPYVPLLTALGVEPVSVPYERFVAPLADLRLLWALRSAFRSARFDVVQNFTVKANLYGAMAAIDAGVPTIINTVEGAGILWSDRPQFRVRLMRLLVEMGLRRMKDRIFRYWFVNRYDRDLFLRRRLATGAQCVVAVATGVDTERFHPAAVSRSAIEDLRKELLIPGDHALVTMVAGRLLRSKGIEVFISMARLLRDSGLRVEIVLVGPEEPEHPDALPFSVLKSAIDHRYLRWIGFRNDIPVIYAASDAVVVTTRYPEGIPKSVAEPMAMGKPVICCWTSAISEMVSDGVDAIVVRDCSATALASAVSALLQDPQRGYSIGRAARRVAVERLNADTAVGAAVEAVYSDVPNWPAANH